jgi:uncharacterized peroxidase-related enzyme
VGGARLVGAPLVVSGQNHRMSYVDPVREETAGAAETEAIEVDRGPLGYLPNFTAVLAHRPAAYLAWKQLMGAVRDGMDLRRYELATLAAAKRLRSSYCMLAHGGVLRERFYEQDEVRAIATDHRAAGLDATDVAVMDLAEKVAADATAITQADVDRLRELGLSDEDVIDVVLAAARRCFFSKTLDALGVQADARFAELDPELRDALVVGRPIAEA